MLHLCSLFGASGLFVSFIIHAARVTLTLETVTTIFELPQSFLLCPLQSEGERMGRYKPGSGGEGEKEKRQADDGLTPSFMGLAGVCDFVINDVRCDAL